jgi:hypothetical protein
MTRAFCAIAKGELRRALAFNPLSPAFFLVAVIAWVWAVSTLLNLEPVREFVLRFRPNRAVSYVALSILLTWWVVRLAGGY